MKDVLKLIDEKIKECSDEVALTNARRDKNE